MSKNWKPVNIDGLTDGAPTNDGATNEGTTLATAPADAVAAALADGLPDDPECAVFADSPVIIV
jgi:hypothetical protein